MPAGRSVSFVHFNLSMRSSYYFIVFYLYINNKVDIIYYNKSLDLYTITQPFVARRFRIPIQDVQAPTAHFWALFRQIIMTSSQSINGRPNSQRWALQLHNCWFQILISINIQILLFETGILWPLKGCQNETERTKFFYCDRNGQT